MKTANLKLAAEAGEQRIVWAEVYAPNIPDSDGDFMDEATIREMAYKFMKDMNLKKIDVQHKNDLVNGACVVESFIAREGDPHFIAGSWVVGVHIDNDEVWGKVKKGEINGFSIEAMVQRSPAELEIELPPVLHGKTMKSEDHEHEFFVTYDEEGNFKGGYTNDVNGHRHQIVKGTVTEATNGHTHRFSFVENLRVR